MCVLFVPSIWRTRPCVDCVFVCEVWIIITIFQSPFVVFIFHASSCVANSRQPNIFFCFIFRVDCVYNIWRFSGWMTCVWVCVCAGVIACYGVLCAMLCCMHMLVNDYTYHVCLSAYMSGCVRAWIRVSFKGFHLARASNGTCADCALCNEQCTYSFNAFTSVNESCVCCCYCCYHKNRQFECIILTNRLTLSDFVSDLKPSLCGFRGFRLITATTPRSHWVLVFSSSSGAYVSVTVGEAAKVSTGFHVFGNR